MNIIKNIFISEFNDRLGKQIICQYPLNQISNNKFQTLAEYIIP